MVLHERCGAGHVRARSRCGRADAERTTAARRVVCSFRTQERSSTLDRPQSVSSVQAERSFAKSQVVLRHTNPSRTLIRQNPENQAPVLLCTTETAIRFHGPKPQYYCVLQQPDSRGRAPDPSTTVYTTEARFQGPSRVWLQGQYYCLLQQPNSKSWAPHDWGLGLQARLLLCTTETQSAEPFWASSDIFCSQAASLLLLHYIAQCTDGKLFLDFALAVYSGLNWCGLEDLLSAASPPL